MTVSLSWDGGEEVFTLMAQECQWILLEFQDDEDGDEDDDDLLRVAEFIMQSVIHFLLDIVLSADSFTE